MTYSDATADTYIERLVARLAAAPQAAVCTYRHREVRAADFLASVHRYARALQALGVARTSVVALLAPNAPDAIAVRYATNLLGAAACYLSAPPTVAARAALIAQVAPTHLVLVPETLYLLPRGVEMPILAVGDCGPSLPRLDALAALQTGKPLASSARAEDLAVIISSRGSTGVPKGSCRDFATYTRMVAAPEAPTAGSSSTGTWPISPRSWLTSRSWAAARWCCAAGSTQPTPWPRSRPSGSPTCSWSSRSCSS